MATSVPVLAVDDSAPIREMIMSVLRPRGYRVLSAANGRDALQRLREAEEPYVVLLDVVMPVVDGIGVWREIQSDPQLLGKDHRVILMSSTIRLTAPDIPATHGQLVKPFTRQELLMAIEAVRVR